jgi:hypothetical protein
MEVTTVEANVGDRIEVRPVQVAQPARRGTVRECLSREPLELRVAWDDGHESVFFPSGGMVRVIGADEAAGDT